MNLGLGFGLGRSGVPGSLLLYLEGGMEGRWIEGSSEGDGGSVAKNADHLRAEVSGNLTSTAFRTWVTELAVDLAPYGTARIEWENDGETGTSGNKSRFVVSTDQLGGPNDEGDMRLSKTGVFDRQEGELDVSGLTGLHFLRVHPWDDRTLNANTSDVRVYRIWLER